MKIREDVSEIERSQWSLKWSSLNSKMLKLQVCFDLSLLKHTIIQAGRLNCTSIERLTTGVTTGLLQLLQVMLAKFIINLVLHSLADISPL